MKKSKDLRRKLRKQKKIERLKKMEQRLERRMRTQSNFFQLEGDFIVAPWTVDLSYYYSEEYFPEKKPKETKVNWQNEGF